MKLNESNLQRGFLYSNVDNAYSYKSVESTISLSGDNCKLVGSALAVDLGYTLDGVSSNWIVSIDNTTCKLITLSSINDLPEELEEDSYYFVDDDPYLSSIIFVNSKYRTSSLYFKIQSLNTTLSSWMLDDIAKKVNNFDVAEYSALKESVSKEIEERKAADTNLATIINQKITEAESKVDEAVDNIGSLRTDLETEMQEKSEETSQSITEMEEKVSGFDTDITKNKEDITALQSSVDNKQDKLTAGDGISIEDNVVKTTFTKAELETKIDEKVNKTEYDTKVSELETKIGDKIIRGEFKTKDHENSFSNIKYLEYDDTDKTKELTADYTEADSEKIKASEIYSKVVSIPVISTIHYIGITVNEADKKVVVSFDATNKKICYINLSSEELSINGLKLQFYIRGI